VGTTRGVGTVVSKPPPTPPDVAAETQAPGGAAAAPEPTATPAVDPWEALWPEPSAQASAGSPKAETRAAVARYFSELTLLEGQAQGLSNPQQLAMRLLRQVAEGDTSGFDELIATLSQAREQIRAVQAPAPCREHQRITLELADAGLRLLRGVRDGALRGDLGALLSLTTEARGLETRARELEEIAAQIRHRYGLPEG
jgi:hypothetical protein